MQIPAVSLKREGDSPGNAAKIFRFQASAWRSLAIRSEIITTDATAIIIRVSKIEPQRPVRPQHAPNLAEHGNHLLDIFAIGRLETDLSSNAIVPQPKVRRATYNTMHALR